MNDACEKTKGSMAVVMGLDAKQVEEMVDELKLPLMIFGRPISIVLAKW